MLRELKLSADNTKWKEVFDFPADKMLYCYLIAFLIRVFMIWLSCCVCAVINFEYYSSYTFKSANYIIRGLYLSLFSYLRYTKKKRCGTISSLCYDVIRDILSWSNIKLKKTSKIFRIYLYLSINSNKITHFQHYVTWYLCLTKDESLITNIQQSKSPNIVIKVTIWLDINY